MMIMRLRQALPPLFLPHRGSALTAGPPSSISAPQRICVYPKRTYSRSTTTLFAIVDEVTDEMKRAMKAKDQATLQTIRLLRTAFANAAIDLKVDKLSDDQAISALKKMAKMRKESISMYEKNDAPDRAEVERAELEVIERWLPAVASDDTVRDWVIEAIGEAGRDNMGKVMGALMKKHKSEVDGAVAQRIVKEELAKLDS